MKKCLSAVLMLAAFVGLTSRVVAQEAIKPLAVVTFSGYDQLIKDLEYVGQLSNKPDLGKTVEGLLGFFTQGQGLAGLDKARPWGALVATDGVTFPKGVYLPVSDVEKLMASLVAFVGVPEDAGDGVWKIEVQANMMPLYVKAEDGWARIAQQPEEVKALPKDPTPLFGGLEKKYDIAVRALMSNIPEELKQQGIGFMQMGLNSSLQPKEDEDEEAFQQRKKLAQQQIDAMIESFNDMDSFTVGWSIDQAGKKTFVDLSTAVRADTKSAAKLAAVKDLKSDFAGFFQPKGMFAFSGTGRLAEDDAAQARQQLETARAQLTKELEKSTEFPNEESKAAVTSLISDLFDLANGVIDSGKTDVALSVSGAGPFTLLVGGYVGEGANLTQLVDKIANVAKLENVLASLEKDFAQQDGVSFHKIAIKAPTGEEADKVARLLGPGDVQLIVGTGKDRLYFGAGADALKGIQAAMEQSKTAAGNPAMPVQMSLSLAAILKAAAYIDDAQAGLALLGGMLEQSGNDKVLLTYQTVDNTATMRLEAQEGVIQVLGTLGAQRQANQDAGL